MKISGSVTAALAVAACVGASPAAAKPSLHAVEVKVKQRFTSQFGSGSAVTCRATGSAAWSCQVRTEEDQLVLATAIKYGDSGIAKAKRTWFSYRCTARYAKGRITVGNFEHHDYSTTS